jgi:bis(5'-nucleosyl)-tetraphosphatase (symmetrical)
VTANFPERIKRKDTMHAIFAAPDCDELVNWLRHKPLFHYENGFGLLHAGLPPQWDLLQTIVMAKLAEQALQADDYANLLAQLYGNSPNLWSGELAGIEQIRFIINCFTRMRFCDKNGRLEFENSGELGSQPPHLKPWFELPQRKTADVKLIFGHWSALGFYQSHNCYAIDTGCVWGRELTALRLDDLTRFSVSAF